MSGLAAAGNAAGQEQPGLLISLYNQSYFHEIEESEASSDLPLETPLGSPCKHCMFSTIITANHLPHYGTTIETILGFNNSACEATP